MPEIKKGSDEPGDSNDNPPAIDPDNPKPEDIKNLQKLLSDRDVELKNALALNQKNSDDQKKLEADKKKKADEKKSESELEMQKLRDDMKAMSDVIGQFNIDKKKAELAEEYPDIMPELIVGKTDEQIEKNVEKQRAKNKEMYGDSKFFIKPKYESADDVQIEIDKIKEDKTLRGDQGAIKVLHLMREKLKFNK